MTQKALAEVTGLPQSSIANVERGRNAPTITTISRLAAATGHTLTIALEPEIERPTPRGDEPMSITIERGAVITEAERRRRTHAVSEAIHSTEMEGGQVTPETQADLERYARGEIDYATLTEVVEARYGIV